MEDTNLMKVKKYIPKLPGSKDDTGYNSDSRQVIEQSFLNVQTTVDFDSENFKYGLDYTVDNLKDPSFLFQDPLFPTFDIILDSVNSPLLINDKPNGLSAFLQDYSQIYSIRARQKLHLEFKQTLYTLFNADFRPIERNKSYYINSITGLDKFTARIVDFEKDKITINLNEDASMISAYLAHLYNNLSYSYRDQRQMIPANLLRFNMYIKVHDVRNMPFYVPDGTGTTTKFDKSYQIYLLRDCSFDFRKSKNFEDSITVGGFDAGVTTKPSSISIDVVYKSIEIESEYPLLMDSLKSEESNALKLNNKDKDVLGYQDGLNTVFQNNAKTPDNFATELENKSKLNNDESSGIIADRSLANSTDKDGESKQNSNKFKDKTSSEIGRSETRNSYLEGGDVPVYNTDKKGDLVSSDDNQRNRENKIYSDPPVYNTDGSGDVVYLSDTQEYISANINTTGEGDYLYNPSVYDTYWNPTSDSNSQHPQTGIALNNWRDSIMGQLNFNLEGFLFSLPITIINMFFGGYHGMQPMYIFNMPRPIPPMEIINVNDTPPTLEGIDEIRIDTTAKDKDKLDAKIESEVHRRQPFNIRIDTHTNPKQPLSGSINIEIKPKLPFNEFIPFSLKPEVPLSGSIDTSFVPHPPVSGKIDTSFTPHQPVSGSIDTSFTPHPPVNGTIDTSIKPRVFDLDYLYNNINWQRTIDLGLLYVGVTHDNIVPITYLYTRNDKFKNLVDYKLYNNVNTEIKSLNEDIKIDQPPREIEPLDNIYEYDNNVNISKTLNEIESYNNDVEKQNNMTVINVISSVREKTEFEEPIKLYDKVNSTKTLNELFLTTQQDGIKTFKTIYLYNNNNELLESKMEGDTIDTNSKVIPNILNLGSVIKTELEPTGEVRLGSLYQPSSIEKLLEPIRLFEPVKKKVLNMGSLYDNEVEPDNIFKPKPVPVEVELIERKEFEKTTIEQNLIKEKPLAEKYIMKEEELERKTLHGDNILSNEYKKEKEGLDRERIR